MRRADLVRLEAIVLADLSRVTVNPPATLRCSMAEAIVSFVRGRGEARARPRRVAGGGELRLYDCRGRNRVGALISEHGKGNALDIRGLTLANGRFVELTNPQVARDFREKFRASVCARFTTVLGPGSDGYHENHVHVDLAQRASGYRMCQWDVRDPEMVPAAAAAVARAVPLPTPRPKIEVKDGRKL
jgi:hypothetical protein